MITTVDESGKPRDAVSSGLTPDEHHRVVEWPDGLKVFEHLRDLMLPGADGMELMRQVRQRFDRPVIFISGYGRDETVARTLDSGAADYIVKPFLGQRTRGPGARGAQAPRPAAARSQPAWAGSIAASRRTRKPGSGTQWHVRRELSW